MTPGGNPFFAYPYMLRRSMVFGNEDLDAFKVKLVTFVRTARAARPPARTASLPEGPSSLASGAIDDATLAAPRQAGARQREG